jgi:hypothetical protein
MNDCQPVVVKSKSVTGSLAYVPYPAHAQVASLPCPDEWSGLGQEIQPPIRTTPYCMVTHIGLTQTIEPPT